MKKGVMALFLVLSSVYFVSAVATTINIQTFSNDDVMISVLQPGSVYDLIQSFHGVSDADGKFSAILDTDVSPVDVKVWIKRNNEVIVSKRFDDQATGSAINLDVYSDSYVKPVTANVSNQTQNTTNITQPVVNTTIPITNTNNSSTTPQPGLTGFSTSQDTGSGGFFSKQLIYFFVGLIVVVGAFFLGSLALKRKREYSPREVKSPQVRKLSEFLEERKHRVNENYGVALSDAEKKLKEAQAEINRLKNAGKIEDAKRKLVNDERELMRLRRGEN